MRGIAILAIMLHNYCHFIGKIVKENEYMYQEVNNNRLWQVLTNPDELLPVHLPLPYLLRLNIHQQLSWLLQQL